MSSTNEEGQPKTSWCSPDKSAELVPKSPTGEVQFGWSVGISRDGSTALVGAPSSDNRGEFSGVVSVFNRRPGGWRHKTRLAPGSIDRNDKFGNAVGVSSDGTTALVGAPFDENQTDTSQGSTYVYRRDDGGWAPDAKLKPDTSGARDHFGTSVAVTRDGEMAAVGAPDDETPAGKGRGAVYVFTRTKNSWTQTTKLTPVTGSPRGFGDSVTITTDGQTILSGAPYAETTNGGAKGTVYVFSEAGGEWVQQSTLTPNEEATESQFGDVVAADRTGDIALVGAPWEDSPNNEKVGAAYVYGRSNEQWQEATRLSPDEGDSEDSFGAQVSLSNTGDVAVIGAPGAGIPSAENTGKVYVYERTKAGWQPSANFTPSNVPNGGHFGAAVKLSADGGTALIGAPEEVTAGTQNGTCYVYES